MQLFDRLAHPAESRSEGLDQEEELLRLLNFPLPAVNRFHLRDDVDARCQALLHQGASNLVGFFFGSRGAEDEFVVGHIKSMVAFDIASREAAFGLFAATPL